MDSLCSHVLSRMALVTLLLLGWLGLVWCCSPAPGAINIAGSGNATQSSDYEGQLPLTGYASKAIDGVKDQIWANGYCSHTNVDRDPWWRLDLKEKQKVNVVVVYGRWDCCWERMQGLEVRVGDSPDNNNPVCGTITDITNPSTSFCCNGMEGQYISAVIPGRNENLHLCEVEVYVDPPENVCW